MRGRPAGSLVWLRRFEWKGDDRPALGMYLVTDAGSGYHLIGIEETSDPCRFHFLCEKVEPVDIPAGARVVEMYWTRRR